MKITKIVVLTGRHGTDQAFLHTELPPDLFAESAPPPQFHIAKGTGVGYCLANFPNIPIEEIDISNGECRNHLSLSSEKL